MTIDKSSFMANLEEAMEVPEGSLSDNSRFKENNVWSSISALMTIAMIFSEYDVQITGDELVSCNSVKDIYDIVVQKMGA